MFINKLVVYFTFPFIILWSLLCCLVDIVLYNPVKTLFNGLKYLPYAMSHTAKSQFKNLDIALRAIKNNCSFDSQCRADYINGLKSNSNKDW